MIRDAEFRRIAGDGGLMRAAADEDAMKIVPPELVAEVFHGANEMVDPILLADLAEIDEEMTLPLAPSGVRIEYAKAREIWPGTHDEDHVRRLRAARQGDLLVAVVGRDDDVGDLEGSALEE